MNTALPLLLIGLVFGGGIGFTIAAANGITLDGHDHTDPAHHGIAMRGPDAPAVQGLPAGMTPDDICTSSNPAGQASRAHAHEDIRVIQPSDSAPSLALEATKDTVAGWNLHIQTEHFEFSPQNASGPHVEGEGHAHVYVNGQKLGRYYGDWVHLDNLPAGQVVVEVTLNANDHRPLAVGDETLAARISLRN